MRRRSSLTVGAELTTTRVEIDDLAAGGRSATDAIHSLTAVAGPAVQPIDAIVGGAASFDNSGGASLRVEGGQGRNRPALVFDRDFDRGVDRVAVERQAL